MSATPVMPERFVFVVTYGRSGSTLLQKLLNALPGYCIRGENGNGLFRLFQAWHDVTARPEVLLFRRQGKTSTAADAWFGAETIEADAFAKTLVAGFVKDVLRLPEGTRVGGFKEVRWHKAEDQFLPFMRFIHTYFPNVKVVINTRNLASVAKSGWWAKRSPERVKQILGEAEKMFAAYKAEFPDATIALHYDDFRDNPDAFAPLYEFLGETFDAEVVRAILSKPLPH